MREEDSDEEKDRRRMMMRGKRGKDEGRKRKRCGERMEMKILIFPLIHFRNLPLVIVAWNRCIQLSPLNTHLFLFSDDPPAHLE